MKKISSVVNCIFSLTLFCILSLISPLAISAGDTSINLSQSIFPVRFIYLDNDQNIIKIWNNVSPYDDTFILKFFYDDREIDNNKTLMEKYIEVITYTDLFIDGYILIDGQNTPQQSISEVRLIRSSNGYEEIHTYI